MLRTESRIQSPAMSGRCVDSEEDFGKMYRLLVIKNAVVNNGIFLQSLTLTFPLSSVSVDILGNASSSGMLREKANCLATNLNLVER